MAVDMRNGIRLWDTRAADNLPALYESYGRLLYNLKFGGKNESIQFINC